MQNRNQKYEAKIKAKSIKESQTILFETLEVVEKVHQKKK